MELPLLRNGILLGMIFSLVAMLVFYRTFVGRFAGQMLIVSFQPFVTRFALGVLIGGIIPLAVVLGLRYAVILYATRNIPH